MLKTAWSAVRGTVPQGNQGQTRDERVRGLDTDALCQQLAVIGRVAEQQFRRLCTLEVQVRGVFPREADAAVDLDVLGGGVEVGLAAIRLGERCDRWQLVVHLCR